MSARCVIAGGGPAGMVLGFLLARAGVRVQVFEKHADFLRDFRGDTIHPSTLEVIHELGILDALLALLHQEALGISAAVGNREFHVADFTHLPTRCRFVAFMPQWDFLNFVANEGRQLQTFGLEMQAEVTGLVESGERVTGVRLSTAAGQREEPADLVVAADGRHSTVRAAARLPVQEFGAPMDVLWFRMTRTPSDPTETMGRFDAGRIFIAINRGDYWQCGVVIPKGTFERIKADRIEVFRTSVARAAPYAADRVDDIRGWDDVNLLTGRVVGLGVRPEHVRVAATGAGRARAPLSGSAASRRGRTAPYSSAPCRAACRRCGRRR